MSAPAISVLVPTYRRPELLRMCVTSLVAQRVPAGTVEIVVVDDASGDETTAVLGELQAQVPGLIALTQHENRGPAAARNAAVAASSGSLLLFVDDDVVAHEDLVATHLALHADGDEKAGVVGLVEWLPTLDITRFMRWLDTTDLQFSFHTRLRAGPLPHPADAFYTCNLSMQRTMFDIAGGFDERFPYPAYEDIELALRLAQHGFVLSYRPEALAWHARPVTLAQFRARMVKVGESAELLRRTHPDVVIDHGAIYAGARRWWQRAALQVRGTLTGWRGDELFAQHCAAVIADGFVEGQDRVRRR
ncbi:MAG TPA: glycosyltransferase [Mycobacteriales bacterium]|nr:glycosyltransferase [Mycobacteriales bacterium]